MNIYFLGTSEDTQFLPRLKAITATNRVSYSLEPILTWHEVKKACERNQVTKLFSTSPKLLEILLTAQGLKKIVYSNYQGSFFQKDGIEIVFVPPLAHLVTVPYGKFLIAHYLSKLTSPQSFIEIGKFNWELGSAENFQENYTLFESATLISIDIETFRENCAIRCVGYSALLPNLETKTIVIPCDSMYNLAWIRKFNSLPAPKVFQNGKYDLAYLTRYDAVPYNYLFDTATFFHSWYSELPKDLAFLQSFCVRESMYWKDLAETQDLFEYYKYNAKDCHATLQAIIYMILKSPEWAKTNFLQEFPVLFPAHLCEMTGIKRDMNKLIESSKKIYAEIEAETKSLDRMLGVTNFNTNSPVQVKALLKILGCGDLPSTDEKNLAKASFRHPLNNLILDKILNVRGLRKLVSTYLVEGKEFKGRILYSLNPHGTDTGRLASKEHHFWCGLQIQNIPRGQEVKDTLIADDDFVMYECDLSQAESRDTAYISGDHNLQNAVECGKDFHSTNASAFFGVTYDKIYSDEKHKTLDKPLRDLAKRVNHGANYNMKEYTLIDTMGLKKIYEARNILKLPKLWMPKQIASHLLGTFHKAYPLIQKVFYPGIISEVLKTHKLTSTAIHDSPYHVAGWVRYCFGDPSKDHSALNAYIAHHPQSLNAHTLNKAFLAVFYNIAIHPIHRNNFKLLAQIHDSILFQVRRGHEYLAEEVQKLMQIPVTVTSYSGETKTFTVPADIKAGKESWGSIE